MTDAAKIIPDDDDADTGRGGRKTAVAVFVLCVAVVAAYYPLRTSPGDNTQSGGDFQFLHARRMEFAREQIFEHGVLPGWYPRELMGTPFWANMQNFPLIPTRLVLYAVSPLKAFTVGVMLSAVLAALFTFAYARALGLSRLASAGSGWTFACSGYYVARMFYGGLPLLEAYPSLPLLLWLIEVKLGDRRRPALALVGLAAASFCIALAGHPQLPAYAFVIAGAYLIVRGWGVWRRVPTSALAMGLGVACAAFVLLPMLLLIGRSTRVLGLAREVNNVALPYGRLDAFVLPWRDGWPVNDLHIPGRAFTTDYPDFAYFYETVNFVGWAPLAAALFLVAFAIGRRQRPHRVAVFLAAAGLIALAAALPLLHGKPGDVSPTLLRSPARMTYVTTFVLAMALGAGLDVLRRLAASPRAQRLTLAAAACLLAAHAVQLALHNRAFIQTIYMPVETEQSRQEEAKLRELVGDGRVAIDNRISAPFNRRIDDVGSFDSLLLARPYATLLAYANAPADLNLQRINGSQLRTRALEAAGVKVVMTPARRPDLTAFDKAGDVPLLRVPDPVPRAMFLPASSAVYVAPEQMRAKMRDKSFDPHTQVMLPPPPGGAPATAPSTRPAADVATCERLGTDEIVVRVRTTDAGFVRVLESFDPGWRAEVDGKPAEVLAADDTFLGVALPAGSPGERRVRFTYHTPGATTGIAISLIAATLLVGLLVLVAKGPPPLTTPKSLRWTSSR